MRTTTRLFTLAVAVTALVLPGSVVTAASPAPPAGATTIVWTPCVEDPTAECGTLRVPVDWARPRGPSFELALARRKATDPAARIGSLLINPGGPGGSGVDFAIFFPEYFSDEIRSRFDLVGFDPRGVARSHPILCSLDLLLQTPEPVITSQAEFDALVAFNRRLGQDCRQRSGPLFDHVDTVSVARDLDAIRAAVGDRRLSYYGISYGTLIGQMYAELFPGRIRALALDSNMDHSLGTRGFLDTETETAQASFDEFVAWCGRAAECALHGRDVRAVWADLLARADRGELRLPDGTPLSAFLLIDTAVGAFYGPLWAELAQFLAILESPAATRALLSDAFARLRGATGYPRGTAQEPPPEAVNAPFQAIFCADYALPVRDHREYARHLGRSAEIAPDMRYSSLGFAVTDACLGWPGRVNNPQHRLDVDRPAQRLLLTNSLFDPATAYAWAVNAAQQLGREAVFFTYEGWGHGVYGRGPCPTDIIDGYLVSRALPAPGTRCPAIEPTPEAITRRTPQPTPARRF